MSRSEDPSLEGTNLDLRIVDLWDTAGLSLLIPASVNQASTMAVVDTAAHVTVVSEEFSTRMKKIPTCTETVKLRNAEKGSWMYAKLAKDVTITVGSRDFSWPVFIAPINDDLILGLDFLKTNGCQVDLGSDEVTVQGVTVQASLRKDAQGDMFHVSRVTLGKRVVVPPNSVRVATGKVNIPEGRDFVFQAAGDQKGLILPAVLVTGSPEIPVCLVNVSEKYVTLKSNHLLGRVVEVEQVLADGGPEESSAAPAGGDLSGTSSDSQSYTIEGLKVRTCELEREGSCITQSPQSELGSVVQRLPEHIQGLFEGAVHDLSDSEKIDVAKLLLEYEDVFSKHDLDLGHFTAITHKIDTGDAAPVKQRMRRTPLGFQEEEEKTLKSMLEAGVIQESQSEWASAPVLVRKKDKTVRYCIDYRDLNAKTVKDAFPLPLIEECIDTLAGTMYFSSVDMSAGYWQLVIDPKDRHKTAFVTRYGQFEHVRMGFGLCNAPATFQRAMNLVLRGLTWKEVLAYLDDVIVLGRSFDEHLSNLREVFSRFRAHHLKLKPRKCALFQSEVDFLGRKVNREGVGVQDSKVQTIRAWPVPTNRTQVESFLGFANYHREFIDSFADMTACLYDLTGPKSVFGWTVQHQEAFEKVKTALATAPVLAFPHPDSLFILDTDASDLAIGAELSQVHEGQERTVAYSSFVMTPAQRKYCTTRKELLAVVTFTRQFRHYLLGRKFVVRTDHSSLVWLLRFKHIEGQLARWLEELSQFDMEIQHRAGKRHLNADALSRIPDPLDACDCYRAGIDVKLLPCQGCAYCQRAHRQWSRFEHDVDDVIPLAVKRLSIGADGQDDEEYFRAYSAEQLRELQLRDPDLKVALAWLETGNPSESEHFLQSPTTKHLWWCRSQLVLKEQVLYYQWDQEGQVRLKLVVPDSLKDEVMQAAHESRMGGHFGQDKTVARLKQSFYWYQMSQDSRLFVRTCAVCSKNKKANMKARAGLGCYTAGYPGERVHLDILGPFVPSERGNRYVLMVVDQFSKWVECYALPDQTAETIARAFFSGYVARFGPPLQLHTDQGKNVDGNLVQAFCDLLEISKTRTTPYRPNSNGQVERYNRVVLQFIRCFLDGKQKGWDKYLDELGMSIRATVNRITGFTPNMLFLNREVHMPIDLVMGVARANREVKEPAEYLQDLQARVKETYVQVRERLKSNQIRQKRLYDTKLVQQSYQVGDLVYKLDSSSKVGSSKKLRQVWAGPFLVVEVLSPVLYRIESRKAKNVIHHDRLKLCQDRVVPLWLRRRRHNILQLDETIGYDEEEVMMENSQGGERGQLEEQTEQNSEGQGVVLSSNRDLDETIGYEQLEDSEDPEEEGEEDMGLTELFKPVTRVGRVVNKPSWLNDYQS